MGNNLAKIRRKLEEDLDKNAKMELEERLEIIKEIYDEINYNAKHIGRNLMGSEDRVLTMMEKHFSDMNDNIEKKLKEWMVFESKFLNAQTEDMKTMFNTMLEQNEFYNALFKEPRVRRSTDRESIEDILDSIHSDQYLNITKWHSRKNSNMKYAIEVTNDFNKYEITLNFSCLLIIMTLCIMIYAKIRTVSKNIKGKLYSL